MNTLLLTDFYKVHHHTMYPEGTTLIYSNFTPRKSRIEGVNEVVVFGIQHFLKTYLIDHFDQNFFIFNKEQREGATKEEINSIQYFKKKVINEYKRHVNIDTKHIEALWDLGYLPLEIKALPEGSKCPIGVPLLTVKNTHPDFFWLTNYLETLMSNTLWQPITSATIANEYRRLLNQYAMQTVGNIDGVIFQAHDFSMRGMSSVESSILSGMGHLTSFCGTDSIPAIYQLEESYGATGLIGASVPATEHSVMCMGMKEDEIGTFERLLDLYPTGILSVVSDTWDLWKVCTEYLPQLKDKILARDGKLVIRPDSGDPVDIICGKNSIIKYGTEEFGELYNNRETFEFIDNNIFYVFDGKQIQDLFNEYGEETSDVTNTLKGLLEHGVISILEKQYSIEEQKGVIELLWDVFGGTVNKLGYKELDSHIGAIYGDSITLTRAKEILERLKDKGFASNNIVFGVGSYTYQMNTRDTFGFAMKATYGEITHKDYEPELGIVTTVEAREIFKDPITDDGTKKSKKGLLRVSLDGDGKFPSVENANGYKVYDQQTWEQEATGALQTVFLNGELTNPVTLDEIRERVKL